MPFKPKYQLPKEAITKLPFIVGRELSYKDICRSLDIEQKTGNSKLAQIAELQKYCDLKKIDGTQRYAVGSYFGYDVANFVDYLNADEQQLLFDCALYQEFLKHPDQPLYLSGTEMLLLFNEINQNFLTTFDRQAITAVKPSFAYMSDMSQIVYRILHQWAMRRIDNLDKRRLVLRRRGFRVYTIQDVKQDHIVTKHNVEPNSDLERRCQKVWSEAYNAATGQTYTEATMDWMPEAKWVKFKTELNKRTRAEFEQEGYVDIRPVMILSPMSADWLKKTVDYILTTVGKPAIINQQAKQKVLYTTQLDAICTNNQRKEFIAWNIDLCPPNWYTKNPHRD